MPKNDHKIVYEAFRDSDLHTAQGLIYSDKPLNGKLISKLMHVESTLSSTYDHEDITASYQQGHSIGYYLGLMLASVTVAMLIGFVFSYVHEVGPFSQSREFHLL